LKVVILGPAYPLRGGIADFNEALANSLLEAGNEVILFSFYYQYPGILFPGTSQFSEGKGPENLKIVSSLSSVNPISWFQTAKKIIKENPDLVIVRFWLPFMAPALGTVAKLLRRKKVKVIAITDNVVPHEKRPGDKVLTGYFINQCDGFVTMSRAVLDQLSLFSDSDKKVFLPHPIYNIFGDRISKNEARKNLNLNSGDRIILFFGFIRAYKGLNLLLDAMNDDRIRERKIKLIVAGEFYEDSTPYLEKIKSNKLEESIILHSDFIEKSRIRDYFCSADLIVQPYTSATQSGITQIAYFFGRPMLVTNVGGLAEIVNHNKVGYVVERSKEEIVNALCDFYDNNRESGFASNVDMEKERFTWKSFIEGLNKLHESIQ
jgi:glycosyltransferase involved in cell wall biosynthesis